MWKTWRAENRSANLMCEFCHAWMRIHEEWMRWNLSSAKPAHLPSSVGGKGISLLVSHEFSYQRLFLSCWAFVFEVSHSDRSEGDSGHVPSSGNSFLFPIRAAPTLNATHSDARGSLEFLIRQIRVHRANTSLWKKAQGGGTWWEDGKERPQPSVQTQVLLINPQQHVHFLTKCLLATSKTSVFVDRKTTQNCQLCIIMSLQACG